MIDDDKIFNDILAMAKDDFEKALAFTSGVFIGLHETYADKCMGEGEGKLRLDIKGLQRDITIHAEGNGVPPKPNADEPVNYPATIPVIDKRPNKFTQHIPGFIDAEPESFEFNHTSELIMHENTQKFVDGRFSHFAMSDKLLMVIKDGGYNWWVIGYIERPGDVDLPKWDGGKKHGCGEL